MMADVELRIVFAGRRLFIPCIFDNLNRNFADKNVAGPH